MEALMNNDTNAEPFGADQPSLFDDLFRAVEEEQLRENYRVLFLEADEAGEEEDEELPPEFGPF
jgi:hypothetical protein